MIEPYYCLLGITLIVLMLAYQMATKWWSKAVPRPLMRGDLVVAPPRKDIVFEVLSYPRPGFVAIRQRGTFRGDPHPIIVVDPAQLRRVRP